MVLLSVGSLFFVFLAIAFGLASILIFADNDKIIPDSFRKNRNHPYYDVWRNFYAAGLLLMVSSFVLFALCLNQTEFNNAFFIYLGTGLAVLIVSVILVYHFNKKALHLFDPSFYKRNNLEKKTPEEKEKERELKRARREEKKESKKRIKSYNKQNEERFEAFKEKEGKK